ncbi:MAG: hypothetical protein JXA60_02800 [Candidatus Coatesbacteria bacterium]|nr:hypothetical protein [Candidatus Coatesbacteria bacterium]
MQFNIKRAFSLIDSFTRIKVAVVGDLIADIYWKGTLTRFSREAPVPIVKLDDEILVPGGAANTSANIASLSGKSLLIGRFGKDNEGDRLRENLNKINGLSVYPLFKDNFKTITKIRIKAGSFHTRPAQILRIDKENAEIQLTEEENEEIVTALKGCDAIILSDYGYGSASPDLLSYIKKRTGNLVIISVDSRYRINEFMGASLLTPNEEEAAYALKEENILDNDIIAAGKKLLRISSAHNLIITRGPFGMAYFSKKTSEKIPICGTTDIVDNTGAGDTVIAAATLSLACGASLREAAIIANCAASVSVMQEGAVAVKPTVLKDAVALFLKQYL